MSVEETQKRYADDVTLREFVRLRVENESLQQQVLMLAGDRDMYIEEIKQFRTAAIFLFGLLDDIDTMDDIVKGDDVRYRNNVRNIHKRRFEIAETDGYNLTFTKKNKDNV